jgi:hypothetical protein
MQNASVIEVTGADGHPVVDNEGFGMKDRLGVLKYFYTLLDQVSVVKKLQRPK